EQRKLFAPQFTRDRSCLNHQNGRRECREEANGTQRVTKEFRADTREKWNQRRLVNISPGQVTTTSDVIEFVAEISVTIVKVEVKEQFGHGDGPDKRHAVGEHEVTLRRLFQDGRGRHV